MNEQTKNLMQVDLRDTQEKFAVKIVDKHLILRTNQASLVRLTTGPITFCRSRNVSRVNCSISFVSSLSRDFYLGVKRSSRVQFGGLVAVPLAKQCL